MIKIILRKHRTLILTLLGLILVFLMLYFFDQHRLDERSIRSPVPHGVNPSR